MRNFLSVLLLVVLVIMLVPSVVGETRYTQAFYFSECDTPFNYKIGSIDPKFGVSEQEFKKDIEQASQIWERVQGKNLFEYDPNAKFSINLVYDERQKLNSTISQLKGDLEEKESNIEPKIADFENRSEEFKKRLEELNAKIDYWNQQGGAPEDEYKKLVEEQNSLREEADSLNEQARILNQNARSYNADVKQLNQTISNFNAVITEKPEEGLYDPTQNKIDIYFNNTENELIHTLAHELGHALGIGHNQNKNSIMYGYTNEKLTLSQEDISELEKVCANLSALDILGERLGMYYYYFKQVYNF